LPWLLSDATRPVPRRTSLLQTRAVATGALQQRQRREGSLDAQNASWSFWCWPFCGSDPAPTPPAVTGSPADVKAAIEKAFKPVEALTGADLGNMASSMEGELAAKLAAGTLGNIGFHRNGGQCTVDLQTQAVGKVFDFVCDQTHPRLHYATGKSWAMARPKPNSGCHSYVFLTGDAPAGCHVGQACPACGSPSGEVVSTVKFEGGTCKSCT